MVVLFFSIAGFLIYRYYKNQRRYLKTLTRTIYDTLQKSNPTSYLQMPTAEGLDRLSVASSYHNQYPIAYVYK
jgi:hypothetical protein